MADERDRTATVDIKLRIKEPLRAEIEAAAKADGVSMNAEMVRRLDHERSLTAFMADALGGPRSAAIFQMLATIPASQGIAETWLDNREDFDRAVLLFNNYLRSIAPRTQEEADAYYQGTKRAIEQLRDPNYPPPYSLAPDVSLEQRRKENLFIVRCTVGSAAQHGVSADRCAELERLFAEAERELRGFA